MKFIVDQQLPPVLAEWLRGQGHEASHVRELGLAGAGDAEIWQAARDGGCLVVTKDEDFMRLWLSREQGGVVWVRLGNCSNAVLVERIQAAWPAVLAQLRLGDRCIELR